MTADDTDTLRIVGEQVAPLLHSMRALAHAQFRMAEARELTSLIRDTAMHAETVPLLERICELACRMLGAEMAGVQHPSPDGWLASYGARYASKGMRLDDIDWPDSDVGEPVLFTAATDESDQVVEPLFWIADEGLRTAVVLPLTGADGGRLGALLLGWRFAVQPSAQLLGLARTFAASATSLLTRDATAAALRDRELLWRVTLDNAPVGICLLQLDGRFHLVNAAMTRILGYSEEELLNRNFASITDPAHLAEKQDLLGRLYAGEMLTGTLDTRCVHADGHSVWTSVSAQLVRDAHGPAYYSVQLEDITFQHDHTQELLSLATHDTLTGLANRRLFVELLGDRIGAARETVVALIDVPGLHGLEDRYGHEAAGEVVRALARRLTDDVATLIPQSANGVLPGVAEQCVARLGSDEFAVMLASTRAGDESTVSDRLAGAFAAPVTVAGRTHTLPAHIGMAVFPGDGGSAPELMHAADVALTEARREGRPVLRHSIDMGLRVRHRERLTADLRAALAEGTLEMAYQPIVDAATGDLRAAEALARWTHPDFGVVEPDRFVPLSEEAGLMPALTSWALNTAVSACAHWQESQPGIAVTVNLSATDLQNPQLSTSIAAILSRHGLAATLLEVELTETSLMTDVAAARSGLLALSALGVRLAVDDFGTGYSSLAYLQRLPITTLKIDRSFVTNMLADAGNAAIVGMVLQLAHTLGITAVAEGVEDQPTGERLRSMHCDRLQGYHIARPMSETAFTNWR